jgi:hypothetical protein
MTRTTVASVVDPSGPNVGAGMSVCAGFGVDDAMPAAIVALGPEPVGRSVGDPPREPIAASARTIATPPASSCGR